MLHAPKLRYLDAIERCGSIRAAAKQLNIASSAINRQLLAIENELDVPLFDRHPKGLKLTAAGEIIIEHVRATLKAEAQARAKICALRGMQKRSVIIAATPGLAEGPMPEIISGFIEGRLGIHVGLHSTPTGEISDAVINGEVDLGLGYYLLPNPALRSLLMLKTDFGIVVAPQHPLATRRTVGLIDLLDFQIVLTEPGSSMRNTIDKALVSRDISIEPTVETNSIETLKRLVAKGSRATLLNPFDVASECRLGTLVFRNVADGNLPAQVLTLVAQAGRIPDRFVSLFAEELRKVLPKIAAAVAN